MRVGRPFRLEVGILAQLVRFLQGRFATSIVGLEAMQAFRQVLAIFFKIRDLQPKRTSVRRIVAGPSVTVLDPKPRGCV